MNDNNDFMYDAKQIISKDLICDICFNPLYVPYEHKTGCGVMFCRSCISGLNKCPVCREDIEMDVDMTIVTVRVILSPLHDVKVECPRCDEFVLRDTYFEHMDECMEKECPAKEDGCDWQGINIEYVEHIQHCKLAKLRKKIDNHEKLLDHIRNKIGTSLYKTYVKQVFGNGPKKVRVKVKK